MKILIINELYLPYQKGGAEISTQLLAEALSEMGHEIHVLTSCDVENDEIINFVNVHRRKQYNIYWSYQKDEQTQLAKSVWHARDLYNHSSAGMLMNLIKKIRPDVIHTNVIAGFSVSVWKVAQSMNIPIVHTLRDYYMMCVKSTLFNKGKTCDDHCIICTMTSKVKKHYSQRVDAVVGISHFILDSHIKSGYFRRAKYTEVIPNAVSIPKVSNVIRDEKTIGYLGRIHPSKGIEFLIECFIKLSKTDFVLQIAGEGNDEYVNSLKEKYSQNNIQFIGKKNAIDFLQSISLLVVPSLWNEPFGRVIVESIACGCPVFVSQKGGMPELINENIGRTFDVTSHQSLTNLLKQYTEGDLEFSFEKSTLHQFSRDSIAREYYNLYQKVQRG